MVMLTEVEPAEISTCHLLASTSKSLVTVQEKANAMHYY